MVHKHQPDPLNHGPAGLHRKFTTENPMGLRQQWKVLMQKSQNSWERVMPLKRWREPWRLPRIMWKWPAASSENLPSLLRSPHVSIYSSQEWSHQNEEQLTDNSWSREERRPIWSSRVKVCIRTRHQGRAPAWSGTSQSPAVCSGCPRPLQLPCFC